MKRTKLEAEGTRRRLLEAGLEVFMQKGFDRTSLEEIAQRVAMTRGAVYWHFKDKRAIFVELVEEKLEGWQQHLDSLLTDGEIPPLQKITSFTKTLLHLLAEEEDFRKIQQLIKRSGTSMPEHVSRFSLWQERYLLQLEQLYWQAQADRAVMTHVSAHSLATFTLSVIAGASEQLLSNQEGIAERKRLADQMAFLLMRSLQ